MTQKLLIAALLSLSQLVAQPEKIAWDVLKQGFDDKDPDKRRQAITATGSIGLTPDAIHLVEEGLQDKEPIVRETAAAELAEMKSTQSIGALKAAMDDPSGEVTFAAAKALWDLGDLSGKDIITEVLTGEQKTSPGPVSSAVQEIKRKMHDPKALALVAFNEVTGTLLGPFNAGILMAEKSLKDGDGARSLAANLLAEHCDPATLQLLEWSFRNDKTWAVKAAAAKGMGECGNPDSIPRLEQALSDSHEAVKDMSAAAIIRLTTQSREKTTSARLTPEGPAR